MDHESDPDSQNIGTFTICWELDNSPGKVAELQLPGRDQTNGRSANGSGRSGNTELLHTGFERGGIETEDSSCAFLPTNPPVCLGKDGDNMVPLHLFQCGRGMRAVRSAALRQPV